MIWLEFGGFITAVTVNLLVLRVMITAVLVLGAVAALIL